MSLKSFLTRLIWICVLPLVILAAFLAIDQVRTLQTQRDLEAAKLARNFARTIDRHIYTSISALQMLAASSAVGDPRRLGEFYEEAQAFRKSFNSNVILADLSRHMIFNTRAPFGTVLPNLPQIKGQSAAAAAAATGKPAVGDMFLGPVANTSLVSIAVPVIRDGRMSELLLGIFEARQFQQHLDEFAIPRGWAVTLLDGKGDVIARRSPPGMTSRPESVEAPGRFVVKSAISPWSIVLDTPHDKFSSPIVAATTSLAAVILAATLAGVLGGMLAGRRLARSVASLAEPILPQTLYPAIAEIETVRRMMNNAMTARDQAESTLRESEEQYRSLVERAPIAIFINRNNTIEYANPAAVRLFGADRGGNVIGRSPYDFVHPDFHAAMTDRIRILVHGGSVPLAEIGILLEGGIERTVEVVASTFVDQQGSAIQVVMHDITERKQADEALRESEERLRLLGDNLPDSYVYQYLHEADGTPRFIYLSAGVERLHGLTREDVLRNAGTLHRQTDPEQITALVAMEAASMESMTDFGMELRMLRADGDWRWMQVRSRPRRKADGQVVWDGVATDITGRKQKEQELQEKNAELERFTYMISHDLKSPLITVKTFLGYLELDVARADAERIAIDMNYMRTAADKMGQMLDELLEMSRIGRVINPPVASTYRELADTALDLVAGRIAERGVGVVVKEVDITLLGDRPRLVEIWQNLVENACKFMGDQAEPRVEIGAEGCGEKTVFYVADNGVGVEPECIDKVFNLCEKLNPGIEGTGLGLTIVKRIVELYQGRIWLESGGPGHGSCFRFTLPKAVIGSMTGEKP